MDRSVENLTIEQLYRKRALDRYSQRASRARKKTRIQELEVETEELKQRLASTEAHVRRLQRSEADLRDIIHSARASLQMIEHHTPSPYSPAEPSPLALTTSNRLRQVTIEDAELSPRSPQASANLQQDTTSEAPADIIDTDNYCAPSLAGTEISVEDSMGLSLRNSSIASLPDMPFSSTSMFDIWSENFSWDDAFCLTFGESGLLPESTEAESLWPALMASTSNEQPTSSPWERLPLHVSPTCHLDTVLIGVVASARDSLSASGQLPEVLGASFPSITSLLNPATRDTQNPISNALGQHAKQNMKVSGIPERFAVLYYMCLFLRWLVVPTRQNFEAMPEYLRPVQAQLDVPHPIWIDTIVWPEAREAIIKDMDWSEFDTLRHLMTMSLSIKWPHDTSAILTTRSRTEMQFSPAFEEHVRQLEHWTLGPAIAERFPFLADCMSFEVPDT